MRCFTRITTDSWKSKSYQFAKEFHEICYQSTFPQFRKVTDVNREFNLALHFLAPRCRIYSGIGLYSLSRGKPLLLRLDGDSASGNMAEVNDRVSLDSRKLSLPSVAEQSSPQKRLANRWINHEHDGRDEGLEFYPDGDGRLAPTCRFLQIPLSCQLQEHKDVEIDSLLYHLLILCERHQGSTCQLWIELMGWAEHNPCFSISWFALIETRDTERFGVGILL